MVYISNVRLSFADCGLFCPANHWAVVPVLQRVKATVEVRKALQSKLEEMIRNEEPVKEVRHPSII